MTASEVKPCRSIRITYCHNLGAACPGKQCSATQACTCLRPMLKGKLGIAGFNYVNLGTNEIICPTSIGEQYQYCDKYAEQKRRML